MSVAGLDCVPFDTSILEPAPPLDDVGAVLGVSGPVLGMDQPETAL